MLRSGRSALLALAVAALAAFALGASPVVAQQDASPLRLGLGYTANAPEMLSGVSGYVIFPAKGGIGLYVDAKFNPDSPRRDDNFLKGRTALQVEDEVAGVQFIDHKDSYRSFNAALVRSINPHLMLYLGAGVSQMTRYRQYFDPSEEMGLAGYFWVEASDEAGSSLNVLGGAFFRMSSVLIFQTGIESNPRGFTVGANVQLPRRPKQAESK
ncbi:MAG TPA: hypothetical protein VLH75_16235 [Longimicrobiales bacterium]|nr:hypothetical protein [Longimicrobiales bacterium]